MNETGQKTLQGSWERRGKGFLVSVRTGGRGEQFVGRTALVKSKAGKAEYVRLTEVIEDYGANDVALYRVERI